MLPKLTVKLLSQLYFITSRLCTAAILCYHFGLSVSIVCCIIFQRVDDTHTHTHTQSQNAHQKQLLNQQQVVQPLVTKLEEIQKSASAFKKHKSQVVSEYVEYYILHGGMSNNHPFDQGSSHTCLCWLVVDHYLVITAQFYLYREIPLNIYYITCQPATSLLIQCHVLQVQF